MSVGSEVLLGLAAYVLVSFPVAVLVGRMLRGPELVSARLTVVPALARVDNPLGRADVTLGRALTLVARHEHPSCGLQLAGAETDPAES
jgi:hypothetical protein